MSRGLVSALAEWRFLLLTLLICAYLLSTPLIVGSWPVQMVLEALLLATVLMTVSANPGWHRLRRVLVTLATVGYGDVLPATHKARMLAMFQAVVGQFYVAVVVALFVGMYSQQPRS